MWYAIFSLHHCMINDMVTLLGKEQVEDDNKKEFCANEFDKADDKKKELELNIEDLGKVIIVSLS